MDNWGLLKDEIQVLLKSCSSHSGSEYSYVLTLMKNIEEDKVIPGESLSRFEERKRKEDERKAICSKCHWYKCRGCSSERYNSKCYRCPCDDCKDEKYEGFTKPFDDYDDDDNDDND